MVIILKKWRSPAKSAKCAKCAKRLTAVALAPGGRWRRDVGIRSQTPAPTSGWFRAAPLALGRSLGGAPLSLGRGPGGSRGSSLFVRGAPALNPRAGAPWPLSSAEQASGQRRARAARVRFRGRRQPTSMAPSAASGGSSLPSGFAVFTTFPDLLFLFEFVSGWRAPRPRAGEGGMGWVVPRALPGDPHSAPADPQAARVPEHP